MFLGLADNIFVDTPGIANTGAAGWVPQSGGVLATMSLDFVNGRAWNAGITTPGALLACARATPAAAYYQNADLTLSTFAANTLRYGSNGLLMEEARTNLLLQSQTLDNASWTQALGAVTANAIAAPDGTLTADLLIENNGNGNHNINQSVTKAASALAYSFTVYAKLYLNRRVVLALDDGSVGNGMLAVFDLAGGQVGVVATPYGAAPFTSGSAFITALANGWYRCELRATTTTTTAIVPYCQLDKGTGTGALNNNYAGDSVSGAYFWGAQLEQASFATSYILTTTVAVTRALDVITFNDVTWFDGTSESMLVTWTGRGIVNANLFTLDTVDDVTLNEQAGISPKLSDAGATYAITTANSAAAGTIMKAACRMATNDIALCLNGGTVGTDVTATQPGAITAARLGVDLAGANSLNGYMLSISAWKSQLLTNAALQSVST